MYYNKVFQIALSIIVLLNASCALADINAQENSSYPLPEGWRTPVPQELSEEICGIGPGTPIQVSADFNGDGTVDYAVIAVNESDNRSGLLVNLSIDSSLRWKIIEEREGRCANYGLDVYKPGIYTGHFCPATASYCKFTKMEQVNTTLPGIAFFDFGRAGVVYFWNKKAGAFDRLWEGD